MRADIPQVIEARARALTRRHGCELHPHGRIWRVLGPGGVDFLVADLRELREHDFNRRVHAFSSRR